MSLRLPVSQAHMPFGPAPSVVCNPQWSTMGTAVPTRLPMTNSSGGWPAPVPVPAGLQGYAAPGVPMPRVTMAPPPGAVLYPSPAVMGRAPPAPPMSYGGPPMAYSSAPPAVPMSYGGPPMAYSSAPPAVMAAPMGSGSYVAAPPVMRSGSYVAPAPVMGRSGSYVAMAPSHQPVLAVASTKSPAYAMSSVPVSYGPAGAPLPSYAPPYAPSGSMTAPVAVPPNVRLPHGGSITAPPGAPRGGSITFPPGVHRGGSITVPPGPPICQVLGLSVEIPRSGSITAPPGVCRGGSITVLPGISRGASIAAPAVLVRRPEGTAARIPPSSSFLPTAVVAGAEQSQPAVNPQYAAVNKNINDLVDKKVFLQRFQPFFDRIADYSGSRLNYAGMLQLLVEAGSGMLGMEMGPEDLSEAEFMRFDFDGDGTLSFKEAVKCFKYNMLDIQKQIGGKPTVPVPVKTPEEAGYQVVKVLASGGQGSTSLANSARGQVALKIYDKNNQNAGGIENLRSEMETMKDLESCPNIMTCIEIFQDARHFYCVNELMPGGDLASLRENANKNGLALTEVYLRGIFKQAASALSYMHKHAMMHCDIKEPNIMLKSTDYVNPQVALIDFGLAQCSAGEGISGGTPGYMPPETLDTSMWFPRGDMFSLGVVFFQIMANQTPSEKAGTAGLFTEGATNMADVITFTKVRVPPWHAINYQYPGVMAWLPSLLAKELMTRPKAPALLQQPWFLGC